MPERSHTRQGETAMVTFVDLYRSEYTRLVQLARLTTGSNALAEEIVQDAFAELYNRFDRLDQPAGYVRRAVISRSTSWVRRRVLERRHAVAERHEPAPPTDGDTIAVVDALRRLDPRQRSVIVMRYLLDWSEADSARALGISVTAARSLLARARRRLAAVLGDDGEHFSGGIR